MISLIRSRSTSGRSTVLLTITCTGTHHLATKVDCLQIAVRFCPGCSGMVVCHVVLSDHFTSSGSDSPARRIWRTSIQPVPLSVIEGASTRISSGSPVCEGHSATSSGRDQKIATDGEAIQALNGQDILSGPEQVQVLRDIKVDKFNGGGVRDARPSRSSPIRSGVGAFASAT